MNDDELLARLKAADPALTSSAPPPDIDRLVEATLSTVTPTPTAPANAGVPAVRSRRHLLGLAASVGLLVLGGGIGVGVMAHDGGGTANTGGGGTVNKGVSSGSSAAAGTLRLTAAGGSAKCVEPTPDTLRKYPTLFVGTVTSIKGTVVTFRVDYWLKGGSAGTVVLDSDTSRPESLTFSDGDRYIVAAEDGVVPVCGANGASADTVAKLRQEYGK
ncbi:hypothetical protein R6V09_22305 [Streptomyces sp. W16]|uniref:hypothetical protein n=1 Tax=Streptomyces sp. W16 TaxID=3076631 RepID=UPI00295B2A2D|nr:hypothetical protein [Streptomyces sp. W16]MDV9172834.1 hypothetical protein [Streptomyces sp. W16]